MHGRVALSSREERRSLLQRIFLPLIHCGISPNPRERYAAQSSRDAPGGWRPTLFIDLLGTIGRCLFSREQPFGRSCIHARHGRFSDFPPTRGGLPKGISHSDLLSGPVPARTAGDGGGSRPACGLLSVRGQFGARITAAGLYESCTRFPFLPVDWTGSTVGQRYFFPVSSGAFWGGRSSENMGNFAADEKGLPNCRLSGGDGRDRIGLSSSTG